MSLEGTVSSRQDLNGQISEQAKVRGYIEKLIIYHTDAYKIAVQHGFDGTVEEWLESLNGYTPVKGIDYWTEEDIAAMIAELDVNLSKYNRIAEEKAAAAEKAADAAAVSERNAAAAAQGAESAKQTTEQHAATVASAVSGAVAAANAAEQSEANAAESERAAAESANAAEQHAKSVDAEELNKRIAAKGDNLEYDADENKLYLTSDGKRISDGITVATTGGGGGGGTSSNNAILTLKNASGWIYKTIASGAECPITFTWSSTEDGLPTGVGVLRITNNDTQKHLSSVEQGTVTLDIAPYISAGSNAINVYITDTYGNSRHLAFNVTAVSLSLASDFDNTVPYTGAFNYIYTPTGAAEKTVHFKIDGSELPTATVTVSGRQQTQPIPAQSHGSHTLEVWFTAVIDGVEVPSNRLYYELICLENGKNMPIIASDFTGKVAEQYDSIVIPYRVYDPLSMSVSITLCAPDIADTPLTVGREVQKWSYRPDTAGEQELTIRCGDTVKTFHLTVTESQIDVEAETDGLALYLSSYGRSNAEDNPAQWVSGNVAAIFEHYNFVSDGWITDADGITALRTTGDARLTIPLKVFEKDFRSTGKTIELDFATRDILNYDAVILSCFSGNRGLQLTAQRAMLKSESSAISTQYKEDEHVRLSFVVQKRSAYRLLQVYINGILSGVIQYPDGDDFSQGNPVNITVGSNECTIDLYTIRVYDNDLTRFQILDNWIADTQLATVKNERWRHNNVFDEYGQIVISQLPKDLPYLIINAKTLPQFKGNKVTVSGQYVDPVDGSRSFTFAGAEADVQGTSSAEYARKNYKIKFKNGFTRNGATVPNYQLRADSVPTSVFTFKADVASSEGANNVELVKLYNDACPYKTPPQLLDSTVRQGIDGYPIVIFQNNGTETVFIGKYNFNNDKATPEVFGFTDDDESWEIRNNTSDRVVWKNNDFTGTDWLNDFEGRHPDGNTDPTNLAALSTWIKSTDTTGLSPDEKAARLAKFKDELGDWMDVDSTLFYYLFTELFLMVDSRAKNAFPTRYDGGVWCWLPYDMDTAIGINNEGALTFGYQLEDTDKTATGADVYNGQASVLWNNVREAFGDELMAMYKELRSNNAISYEDTEARFEAHQAKWSAAIFNEDAYYKYLEPLFVDKNGAYLGMLQGSKAEQRKWWLYNRFRYMDSKYNAGDALKDVITLRGYAKSDITLTPYADIYATIKYGSYLVQKRALRGSSYTLECPLDNVNDTETYIYSASQLADVGDLSGYMVGYADFANGTKLHALKLGDGGATYSNTNLIELHLGNNVLLKTLDVRNCPNLGIGANEEGTVQSDVDISGCSNIEHIYFDGTSIKALSLPNGGVIKTLHLPGTITNLTIRNQKQIADFVLPNYSNITTLRLENVSGAVPTADILAAVPENSRVRLTGFDWSFDSAADIVSLCDRLDTMRGLDENGNNTDKPQVSGTVRVENITGAQYQSITDRYPDINVVYDNLTVYVIFYDEMGENVLQVLEVDSGDDAVYIGETPTKESTAQYDYHFAGWSSTPGGSAESGILDDIVLGGNVYAAFTSTVRTYTVRFYNGTTLLQTVNNVAYGSSATYTGNTPTYTGAEAKDYSFTKFMPNGKNITGDTDCYAQYRYDGLYYVKIVERTIAGTYENSDVTTIGDYAFYYCDDGLSSVSFPEVTTMGENAFAQCANLVSVNIPKLTEIPYNAFSYCSKLTAANFPLATRIGSYSFPSCSSLVTVDFSSAVTIDSYAFENCKNLATVDLPCATSIAKNAFKGCSALTTLILRHTSVVTMGYENVLDNTPIESGTGYIYVPRALVDSYKADEKWSLYAAQFRAIEDYPEVCGR